MPGITKWAAAGGAAVIGIGILWYAHAPEEKPVRPTAALTPPSVERQELPQPAQLPTADAPVQTVSVVPRAREPRPLDEPTVMSTLRQLGDSAPQDSLRLARDANERFPNSPDAAEREWYVCKSLVNLEDFYGAREEARIMVAKYAGTPWADDVQRHLLTNPLDLPGDPPPEK